jgi:hypothetical protein
MLLRNCHCTHLSYFFMCLLQLLLLFCYLFIAWACIGLFLKSRTDIETPDIVFIAACSHTACGFGPLPVHIQHAGTAALRFPDTAHNTDDHRTCSGPSFPVRMRFSVNWPNAYFRHNAVRHIGQSGLPLPGHCLIPTSV